MSLSLFQDTSVYTCRTPDQNYPMAYGPSLGTPDPLDILVTRAEHAVPWNDR